jgi:hypothetical protein
MSTLTESLPDYIHAAFTGLWIETSESDEAEREIHSLAHANQWTCATWDLAQGLRGTGTLPNCPDPLTMVKAIGSLAQAEGTSLILLHNFHRFLNSVEIVQSLLVELQAGKLRRTFVLILAPIVQLPPELEKMFVVLQHELPNREQLQTIAEELVGPDTSISQAVLDSAAGLTRSEAEGAFAMSLIRHDELRPEVIWDLKAQTLKQQNLLSLVRGVENFSSLGGMKALKTFCKKSLVSQQNVKPRGVLLLSPPGCGKSAFCRALGNEVQRPVLSLDLGQLYGSLVGETERNIRRALKIAEAMAPCILFVDELEKGLSGVHGQGDSGVSTRLFGTLLTWLADHTSDVFFIGTANKIDQLPPEFSRAERLDAVFFIDLPTAAQRTEIWELARAMYGITADDISPSDEDWTGAEIKACCRLSALLDVSLREASQMVVPVARTAHETLTHLRDWSRGRCLDAETGSLFEAVPTVTTPVKRRKTQVPGCY